MRGEPKLAHGLLLQGAAGQGVAMEPRESRRDQAEGLMPSTHAGSRERRHPASRFAGGAAAGIVVLTIATWLAATPALACTPKVCTATAKALFGSCKAEMVDNSLVATPICINISDETQRKQCLDAIKTEKADKKQTCEEQDPGDCIVTKNYSLLEPGDVAHKYYAKGIGVILEVEFTDDQVSATSQLVNCNFDARCQNLPLP
jgi:hypothetical protein